MASPAVLMLAFTPFSSDATPISLGLGHEQLIHTETACGSFCLNASNAHFDVTMNAIVSQAQLPQKKSKAEPSLNMSPINVSTFDVSWHPMFDAVVGAGYRTTSRTVERKSDDKTLKRISASSREIPLSVAAKPAESFAIAGRVIVRNIELKQESPAVSAKRSETYSVSPHRWSADALWQKSESTGYALSYVSPTIKQMTITPSSGGSQSTAPQWTDPQEFTFSLAHFTSMRPPDGVTFGPFENVFHASATVATWESGRPMAYAALATSSASKDGWNLTETTSAQIQEFSFDTLDPSIAASAGLESTWMRTGLGSVSTFTHVRLNHLASRRDSTDWQGGFGLGFSTQFLSLQASTLWRDQDAGYAIGLSSAF